MATEIISGSISTKAWDKAGIELGTAGSASQTRHRLCYVARSRVQDDLIRMDDFTAKKLLFNDSI